MRIPPNTLQNSKLKVRLSAMWGGLLFTAYHIKLNQTHYLYYILQNVNSVEVSVPVGNSDHTPYVVGLTTFVVSGGTIYLMVSIFRRIEIPQQLHRQ